MTVASLPLARRVLRSSSPVMRGMRTSVRTTSGPNFRRGPGRPPRSPRPPPRSRCASAASPERTGGSPRHQRPIRGALCKKVTPATLNSQLDAYPTVHFGVLICYGLDGPVQLAPRPSHPAESPCSPVSISSSAVTFPTCGVACGASGSACSPIRLPSIARDGPLWLYWTSSEPLRQ